MISTAVIGLGTIAPMHLQAIAALPEVALAAVCDLDPATRSAIPAKVPFFSDYNRMLVEVRPAAVHICLPHYLHFPAAQAAVDCGCHVFCEKPPAMDLDELERFLALEQAYPDTKISICFQNRRNGTIEALKQRLDSGVYGAVTGVKGVMLWRREAEYYTKRPWRGSMAQAGGGCLMNQAIHTLDLMTYLGGPVVSLSALAGQLLDFGTEVEDSAMAGMTYANGAHGLFVATLANLEDEFLQITVQTQRTQFAIEHQKIYECLPDGRRELLAEDQTLTGGKAYYGSGHFKLISEFYEAIVKGGSDYIHVSDAAGSIRLVDAIRRSAQIGHTVALH